MMKIGKMACTSLAMCVTGCGAPFMQPLATSGETVRDSGLAGEWLSEGDTVCRATITETSEGPYKASLDVHYKGQPKTTLQLDLSVVETGSNRYVDLFLAKEEREKLVNEYGFLALPVHQIMKMSRQDDVLRVWTFDERWLGKQAAAASLPHDRFAIGGGEITVITAPKEQVRQLIAGEEQPGEFGEPIVFHRVR